MADLYNDYTNLTPAQQRQQLPKLARRANSRLRTLRKNNINYYAEEMARTFLEGQERSFFPARTKRLTDREVNMYFNETTAFLNAKSSTIGGLEEIDMNRIESFRAKGFNIKDPSLWNRFIKSNEGRALLKYGDSETIFEDIDTAIDQGFTLDEIRAQYKEFLDREDMTFEQVAEQREEDLSKNTRNGELLK